MNEVYIIKFKSGYEVYETVACANLVTVHRILKARGFTEFTDSGINWWDYAVPTNDYDNASVIHHNVFDFLKEG